MSLILLTIFGCIKNFYIVKFIKYFFLIASDFTTVGPLESTLLGRVRILC